MATNQNDKGKKRVSSDDKSPRKSSQTYKGWVVNLDVGRDPEREEAAKRISDRQRYREERIAIGDTLRATRLERVEDDDCVTGERDFEREAGVDKMCDAEGVRQRRGERKASLSATLRERDADSDLNDEGDAQPTTDNSNLGSASQDSATSQAALPPPQKRRSISTTPDIKDDGDISHGGFDQAGVKGDNQPTSGRGSA